MLKTLFRRATLARIPFLIAIAAMLDMPHADAQQPRGIQPKAGQVGTTLGDKLNENTLTIVSGNLNGTYLAIAYDLSAVLDDGDELRVLPMVGKGGWQNIKDVRLLRGVDLGITQANLLSRLQRTRELGDLSDKIVYIARLFNEEMHLIVRPEITSIEQLRGRKVNFSDIGSGTQMSTRDVFEQLGIPVEEVNMGQADAFEKMKSGEIAATILIAGKPARAITTLKREDGFRILPVPFARPLQADYLPTTLTHEDYPALIEQGRTVESLVVSAVLIAYDWPEGSDRYRRVEKFVEAFFPRLAEFQKPPRHPKWRETNLAGTVPNWKRFKPAEEWLKRNREPVAAPAGAQRGLAVAGSAQAPAPAASERDRLFQEFMQWNRSRARP